MRNLRGLPSFVVDLVLIRALLVARVSQSRIQYLCLVKEFVVEAENLLVFRESSCGGHFDCIRSLMPRYINHTLAKRSFDDFDGGNTCDGKCEISRCEKGLKDALPTALFQLVRASCFQRWSRRHTTYFHKLYSPSLLRNCTNHPKSRWLQQNLQY